MDFRQKFAGRSFWLYRYGFAVFAVVAATAVRFWFDGLLHAQPFPTFFLAVLLVAFVAGSGPALITTFLSAAAGAYYFIEPIGALKNLSDSDLLRITIFNVMGLSIALLTETRARASQVAIDAEVRLAEGRSREIADATLRAREEFIRGVLDSLQHEIAVIDAAGTVIAVNRRWERFAEESNAFPNAVSVGANYLAVCLAAVDAGDTFASDAVDGLRALMRGDKHEFTMEYPCHAPDREQWFLMHAARANCAPAAVVISHTDITGRVQVESQLREATEKLRAADQRKDEFLATLAHELRNPLAPLRNATHVLKQNAVDATWGKQEIKLLSMIERQIEHLIRLVEDLLEVSRITSGKIELKRQDIDLAGVLRNAADMARPYIERSEHVFEMILPAAPLWVNGDPVRLAQVFANLLNNAAKYTEPGGAISLSVERQNGVAVVAVRDNGLGIPEEMLPRVFDLFTQVDRTLGRAQGGLGIGLALVRTLVDMHGGTVTSHSDGLGRGSTFVVTLPLVPERPATGGQTEVLVPTKPRIAQRILVIDDDRDVADSLVMLLETIGADVRVAYSGAAGLDVLKAFNPDVIFLDLGIPEMDGFETARRIRALPEGRGVTLVALSGWAKEQVNDRAREAGFDRQLTKPAEIRALQELLVEASSHH